MHEDMKVCVVQSYGEFWSAALFLGGAETTFDCGHNHHTAQATLKCSKVVLAAARKFTWHPTFSEVEVDTSGWGVECDWPLMEWRRSGIDGDVTTRFRVG